MQHCRQLFLEALALEKHMPIQKCFLLCQVTLGVPCFWHYWEEVSPEDQAGLEDVAPTLARTGNLPSRIPFCTLKGMGQSWLSATSPLTVFLTLQQRQENLSHNSWFKIVCFFKSQSPDILLTQSMKMYSRVYDFFCGSPHCPAFPPTTHLGRKWASHTVKC